MPAKYSPLQLLEARVLAGATRPEDFYRLGDAGIAAEDFQFYGPVYAYIAGNIEAYQIVPRLNDLEATFNLPTGLKRNSTQHAADVQEFKQVVLTRQVQAITSQVVEEHAEDPDLMLNTMLQQLMNLRLAGANATVSLSDGSALSRLTRYEAEALELERRGTRIAGLATGISWFDERAELGWLPGELIGVVARTYMGKTWLLMYFGLMAWMQHKRVLMINPELSKEEAEARFDIMLAARYGITSVRLSQLYRGVHPPADFRQVLERHAAQRKDWATYTSMNNRAFTVADIVRLVRQHKPDLVLIDGLLLLRAAGRGQIWEKVLELSGSLKNMAQGEHVPVIVAHQANRSAANLYRPPRLDEISGGDAFGQTCDRLLAMCLYNALDETPDPSPYRRVSIQKFRKGEEHIAGVRLYFNPDLGQIYEREENDDRSGDSPDSTRFAGPQEQHGDGHGAAVLLP